jgi:hypothetical protein
LVTLTSHAQLRAAQWNLSLEDIEFVVNYGKQQYNTGALFCFLGHNSIPRAFQNHQRYQQLVGTTVLLCSKCGQKVITLYRNKDAPAKDKRKLRYDAQPREHHCDCCHWNVA